MNINKLRIGNFVSINGSIVKLTNIPDLFDPIKIDPVWLIKLGFQLFDEEDNCWAINYQEGDDGYTCDFEININDDGTFYVELHGINVEYIHQLQNAYFKITKKDLFI